MNQISFSIIIVTFNSGSTIQPCLSSIARQTYKPIQTIVLDNASSDPTPRLLAEDKNITFIQNPQNSGFAKANNIALEHTEGNFILFLNPDAQLKNDFLENLTPVIRQYDNQKIGSYCGKILQDKNSNIVDSKGIHLENWRLLPMDIDEGRKDNPKDNTVKSVFGAPGACAIYKKECLKDLELGGKVFKEDFFAFYEDVDLAWRAQKRGWRTLYVPGAVCYHKKKGPGEKNIPLLARAYKNRLLVYKNNESFWKFLFYSPVAVPWETVRIIKRLFRYPGFLKALIHS
ncbi:MAG: glycosyltransferase family 2 protein [Candidatus Omnitrophica bacterium]|nr:glycosyltransferase family 2 protein [Candidatus Omnitrophota bacterium]MDD5610412.1 glycosyltransferase family 2 protein [Candidatus Omnitrophota bacterium]